MGEGVVEGDAEFVRDPPPPEEALPEKEKPGEVEGCEESVGFCGLGV